MRKRDLIQQAAEWIALNDNAGMPDGIDEISGYVSTLLAAELLNVEPHYLAGRILVIRRRELRAREPR